MNNELHRSVIALPLELDAEQGDRPALVGARTVTYRQLDDQADVVSSYLRARGSQVGDRVAIWMDKGPDYAIAILAALDAGCAYVPLDGAQPVSRVETILRDATPTVLFTDQRHLALLSGTGRADAMEIVVSDPDSSAAAAHGGWHGLRAAAGQPTEPPRLGADDLAALLYTSGSTGVPKGVQISHRNLAAFIGWAVDELAVGPDDVLANHASFNFDISTFDLFVATSVGAALWIIGDHEAHDVVALATGIRAHRVSVWYSVPSILDLLVASGALGRAGAVSLRYVLFAGEVFPMPQLRALADVLPAGTGLYNLYGPTETNVCTYYRVRAEDLAHRLMPVPIGAAVGNARLLVVDEDGRRLDGPDACGELVVEGDCVTPGYWGKGGEPAAVGHRAGRHATGDLVSWEGTQLVYRGRKDRMVKLRGYRIELGEVEAAVLRHPDIGAAAVVLTDDERPARLALFYTVPDGRPAPRLLAIKQHCVGHLPQYMVPATAVCLPDLPRNANGKTDYRRLVADGADALAGAGSQVRR